MKMIKNELALSRFSMSTLPRVEYVHAERPEQDHDGDMEKVGDSNSEAQEYADNSGPVIIKLLVEVLVKAAPAECNP